VRVEAVTSVQDDLGNVSNFSKTFAGQLLTASLAPLSLGGRDPFGFRIVQ
jgi:hypothetical protein